MNSLKSLLLSLVFILVWNAHAMALPQFCKLALKSLDNPLPDHLERLTADQTADIKARKLRLAEISEKMRWVFDDGKFTPDQIIDDIAKNDTRGMVFKIEALLRLFDGADNLGSEFAKGDRKDFRKVLDKTLKEITAMEDNIGWYTDAIQWQSWVSSLHEQYDDNLIPPEISKYFDQNFQSARAKFKTFLHDNGWLDGKKSGPLKLLDASTRIMADISEEADRKLLLNGIGDYLNETDRRQFDMTDLDNGIHPFRRHLRWFSLMVEVSNLFQLDGRMNPISEFKDLKLDADTTGKYVQVHILGKEKNPVRLSRSLFFEVVKLVGILGQAKDIGQFEQALTSAYQAVYRGQKAGHADAATKHAEIVASLVPEYVNPWSTAAEQYGIAKNSGLLQELRQEVLAGLH